MPRGRYAHLDHETGALRATEFFSCAPGPAGWRWSSTLADPDGRPLGGLDLTCDAAWRPIRLEASGGGWAVRGGTTGPAMVWVRSGPGAPPVEGTEAAHGFGGLSPAYAVVGALRLALAVSERARVRLVMLVGDTVAPQTVEQGWTLTDVTTHGADGLRVEHYNVVDLATGSVGSWHLAGDVVIAGPGIELETLDGPPSGLRPIRR